MSAHCRARIVRVRVNKHGGSLALAASVGDSTLKIADAGDFPDVGGTLLVDDDSAAKLDFASVSFVEDTDVTDLTSADTITLAGTVGTAIAAGTQVWLWDGDEVVADYLAVCIPEDDEDDAQTGGPILATIPPHFQDDLPAGKQPGLGVRAVLEYDDDTDEWTVHRLRGSARGIRFETNDSYTVTSADVTAGTLTMPLSQRPVAESLKLWWRATFQPPTEYTVDAPAQTVTMPLGSFVSAGDVIYAHYAYRKGLAKEALSPVTFTVVGTPTMGHGFSNTSVSFPTGTQAGDLFLYAATARSTATNTCADARATSWVDQTLGLNTVRIWRGTVSSPTTPLTVNAVDLGGVQEATWGLIVIRPDSPVDWDATKVADSAPQSAGSGTIPGLSGVSGAVGVGFSNTGIGGTSAHYWGSPWPGYIDNGTYARISFVTQVSQTIASTSAISSTDIWRGFALGVGLA